MSSQQPPDQTTDSPERAHSSLAPLTVWLTGARGFIGKRLAARLAQRADIRLLAPTRAELDLSDAEGVDAFIATHSPDVVIHLAAVTAGSGAMRREPGRYFLSNLSASGPILRAVERGALPRVIVAGSAGEYPRLTAMGEQPRALTPADVWRGPPAAGGYGMARRAISQLLLDGAAAAGTSAAVLVLPTVYGPGDGANTASGALDVARLRALPAFVVRMLRALASDTPSVSHFGSGFEVRDFLHVDDAAAAFEAAITAPIGGQRLHITNGEPTTMAALAARIASATGYEGGHDWAGRQPGQGSSDDRVWLAPAGLAELGVAPSRELSQSLAEVVADLRARL